MRLLYSFKRDSVILKKSKFKLCYAISVESSSMWKVKKCLSERMVGVCLNFIEEVSLHRVRNTCCESY